jgi:hypothetical protein
MSVRVCACVCMWVGVVVVVVVVCVCVVCVWGGGGGLSHVCTSVRKRTCEHGSARVRVHAHTCAA